MVAAFEAANPGIEVKVETAPYDSVLHRAANPRRRRRGPGRLRAQLRELRHLRQQGTLLDLTDLAGAEPDFAARFYPRGLRGLQPGRPPVRPARQLLRRRPLLQQGPLRRRRRRLPDLRLDLDRGGRGRQAADRRRRRRLGHPTPRSSSSSSTRPPPRTAAASSAPDGAGHHQRARLRRGPRAHGRRGRTSTRSRRPTTTWPASATATSSSSGKIAMLTTGIWMFASFADAPFNWDIAVEPGNTQKAHHFFANAAVVSADTEQRRGRLGLGQLLHQQPRGRPDPRRRHLGTARPGRPVPLRLLAERQPRPTRARSSSRPSTRSSPRR